MTTLRNRKQDAEDPALYEQVTRAAKRKFTWPSIPASRWVVAEYKRRGGRFRGPKPPEDTGLRKWFDEQWVDISRPRKGGGFEPCMRDEVEGAYPKCLPLAKAKKMTEAERKRAVRRKRRAQSAAGRPTGKKKGKAIMVKTNPLVAGGTGFPSAMRQARSGGGGTMFDASGVDTVRRAVRRLLAEQIELGEQLGCGAFGCAYPLVEHPGWIVKVTTDQTDAAAHEVLRDAEGLRAVPGLPDVRAVFQVAEDHPAYVILRSELFPFGDESEDMGAADHASRLALNMAGIKDAGMLVEKERAWIEQAYPEYARAGNLFARALTLMHLHGVWPTDLAGTGNVMVDADGNWTAADLGIAAAPEVWIPTLREWTDNGALTGREAVARALGTTLPARRAAARANPSRGGMVSIALPKTAASVIETDVLELAADPGAHGLDEHDATRYRIVADAFSGSRLKLPRERETLELAASLLTDLGNTYDDRYEVGDDKTFARAAAAALSTASLKLLRAAQELSSASSNPDYQSLKRRLMR